MLHSLIVLALTATATAAPADDGRVSGCPAGEVLGMSFNPSVARHFTRIGPARFAALTMDSAGAIARFVIDTDALAIVDGSYAQLDTRSVDQTAGRWQATSAAVDGAVVTVRTTGEDRFDAALSQTLEIRCDAVVVVD